MSKDNTPTPNKDYSREFLITKLQCSECGRLMKMSYGKPKFKGSGLSGCAQGEPTGADKVDNMITVYPCHCTKTAQVELDQLRDILVRDP